MSLTIFVNTAPGHLNVEIMVVNLSVRYFGKTAP